MQRGCDDEPDGSTAPRWMVRQCLDGEFDQVETVQRVSALKLDGEDLMILRESDILAKKAK